MASVGQLLSADRVAEDIATSTMIFRKIVVAPDSFDQQSTTKRARQFLIEHPTMKMMRVTWVPDGTPGVYGAVGCDHCAAYSFWRGQWDAMTAKVFPVAELMSIEGNSMLRYRDEHAAVSITRLQGADPRPVRIGDFDGRIIHVGMHGRIESPLPQLYVVGKGPISAQEGADYAKNLATRLGVKASWVQFRSDPWFIAEIWTPFFPLFDTNGAPPTEKEFAKTRTPYCFYFREDNNKCSWQGSVSIPRELPY